MSSLKLENTLLPLPSTERNFTTHLSYDSHTNSIAYPSGKSAYVRSLTDNSLAIQFTGHGSSSVSVVKFSPIQGSQYLASGDDSGKVIVWGWSRDTEEGSITTTIKSEFQVIAGPITDISWDFEGHRLCVVGQGREKFGHFISWDTGNSLGEVSGHSQKINACHIKQSRPMRCFTVGDDGAAVFYQGPPFKFSASDRTHHDQGKFIRDVKFSPGTGKYAISVGSDRKIVCYDGKTGEFIKYIEDTKENINGGLFAISWVDEGENSNKFVTSSADCTLKLWDVESSKCLQSWSLENTLSNQQVGVAVTKDHEIVALSLDGTLNIFKIGEDSLVRRIEGHNKGITALVVNPLVSGSYDGRVVQWINENEPHMENYHGNMIVSIDNTDKIVSTVSWDDTLKVFNNGSAEVKYNFSQQPKVSSANNGAVAVITDNDELLIIDSQSGELLQKTQLSAPGSAVVLGNEYVAVGYEQTNAIQIFKSADLTVAFNLPTTLRATPSCLSLSPSEKYLAAGDVMGKILLFDLESKDVKTSRWAFHTGKINSISWRPEEDGEENLVATGSLDTHMFIYSVKRPMKIIKKLNAHKDGVSVVKWKNKETVVSAGADACIKEWLLELS